MPEMGGNFWLNFFLIYTVVACVLPLIALGVGAYWAYRHGSSFLNNAIMPDVEKMQAAYDRMKSDNPQKSPDELVQYIIRRQSVRCGVIGAITGVGGLPTLPIMMPIDMVLSYRIQGAMVNFIARAYDHDNYVPQEETMMASMVMFGSSKVTEATTHAATSAATSAAARATANVVGEVGSKAIAKVVPFAGAVIGFGVNFLTTQGTGRLAAAFYSGRVVETGGSVWQRFRRLFRRSNNTQTTAPPPPPDMPA
ncbi:MAG: hypothetical protein AAF787_19980 [Chloroflexota bacterium]